METQECVPAGGVMCPPPSFLIRSYLIRLLSNSLTSNSFTLVFVLLNADTGSHTLAKGRPVKGYKFKRATQRHEAAGGFAYGDQR